MVNEGFEVRTVRSLMHVLQFTSFGEVLSRGELFLLDRLVQPLQEEEQRPLKTFYNRVINLKEDGLRMLLDYYPIPYADRLLFFIIPFANTFGLMER